MQFFSKKKARKCWAFSIGEFRGSYLFKACRIDFEVSLLI